MGELDKLTLHTCPPPRKAIKRWVDSYPSTEGNYGHLLLEQKCACDDKLVADFVAYFESAHGDARNYFHAQLGIELHPDAADAGAHAAYPTCLPTTTRRGLFGEVMAGMITECFDYVGDHDWKIPVFLFRFHEDAEQYMFELAREPARKREVYGRRGSDFLALAINDDGEVVRFIAGEAKWRKKLQNAVIRTLLHGTEVTNKITKSVKNDGKGIWAQINKAPQVPHGLRQLQRLLKDIDPEAYSAAILSLDRALVVQGAAPLPRTNLIMIAGNDVPSRDARVPLIRWKPVPAEYAAPHDLQVVELILNDGEELIDRIYDALWAEA